MERAAIMQLLSGYWYTQALYTVARLGVADVLAAGPCPWRSSPTVARRTPGRCIG